MSDDLDEELDEPWDDDDEDVELPVIPDPAEHLDPVVSAVGPGAGRRRRRKEPKGNVKRSAAGEARRDALVDAQGVRPAEQDDWRTQMELKDRGKAAAALSSKKLTHNAGSGFGLS